MLRMYNKLILFLFVSMRIYSAAAVNYYANITTEQEAKKRIEEIYSAHKSRNSWAFGKADWPRLSSCDIKEIVTLLNRYPKLIHYRWKVHYPGPIEYSLFHASFENGKEFEPYFSNLITRGADINHPQPDWSIQKGDRPVLHLILFSCLSDILLEQGIDFKARYEDGLPILEYLQKNTAHTPQFLWALKTRNRAQDKYMENWNRNIYTLLEMQNFQKRDVGSIIVGYAQPSYKDLGDAVKIRRKIAPEQASCCVVN